MIFQNRTDGAKQLATLLEEYRGDKNVIIIGLARGGIVIAIEMAKQLDVNYNLIMLRKIGAPDNPELAVGAITETGEGYIDEELIKQLNISKETIKHTIASEKKIAVERLALYRKKCPKPDVSGKVVILVDDGIATGSTMMAAAKSIKAEKPAKLIIATPVAPPDAITFLKSEADDVISVHTTPEFFAISQFYEEFPQVTDQEILSLMEEGIIE